MSDELEKFIKNNIIPKRKKHKRHIIYFLIMVLLFICGILLFVSRISTDIDKSMDIYGIIGLVVSLIFGVIIYQIISPFDYSFFELKSSIPNPSKLYIINGKLIQKQSTSSEEIDTINTGQHYIERKYILVIRLDNNDIKRIIVNEYTFNNVIENENIDIVTNGKNYYMPLSYRDTKK